MLHANEWLTMKGKREIQPIRKIQEKKLVIHSALKEFNEIARNGTDSLCQLKQIGKETNKFFKARFHNRGHLRMN